MMRRPYSEDLKAVSVQVSELNKGFNQQHVLHDISFDVEPGEIFVIMGPSGSGKSVLLKSIIGLEDPDSRSVLIDGLDASLQSTHDQVVTGIVFQVGALLNSMNVFDNLALYPREHRLLGKKELEDQVMDTLKILSLEGAAFKYPSQLSGGMKKRVAIARALMMKPQLLLYDEPTSELDPIMAASISEIIATLKEKFNVTSIVVSHDRDLAFSIGDRVAILYEGRLISVNTPEELKELDNSIVQEFLNPKIDLKNPRFRKHL